MKTSLLLIALLCAGCGDKTIKPEIGTTVLIFPDWSNSASCFEHMLYTNYYAVWQDDGWHTMEVQEDGQMLPFWKSNNPEENMEDVRLNFGLNINFNILKGIHDAFAGTPCKHAEAK